MTNMPSEHSGLEVRNAAKAVLFDMYGDAVVLVRGKHSSVLNLAGGGIKKHETPLQALNRELHEELGITSEYVTGFTEIGVIEGMTTPHHGKHQLARWSLFQSRLLIPWRELLPDYDHVGGIGAMRIKEALLRGEDEIRSMAKQALLHSVSI